MDIELTNSFVKMMDEHNGLSDSLKLVMLIEYACTHIETMGCPRLANELRGASGELYNDEELNND